VDDVGHEDERDLLVRFGQVFGLDLDHLFGAADAQDASALEDLLFGQIEMADVASDLDGEVSDEKKRRELKQLADLFLSG
jgi:hypothetical protein